MCEDCLFIVVLSFTRNLYFMSNSIKILCVKRVKINIKVYEAAENKALRRSYSRQ